MINWTTASNARYYELWEGSGSLGNETHIYTGTKTTFQVSGRADGNYYYEVRGCNAMYTPECGPFKQAGPVVVHKTAPIGIPAGLDTSAPQNYGNFTISWSAASGPVTYYVLEESPSGVTWSTISDHITGRVYSFTNHAKGSFRFRVKGCGANGCGGYTAAGALTAVLYQPPSTPPAPSASANPSGGNFLLTWPASTGATVDKYQVNVTPALTAGGTLTFPNTDASPKAQLSNLIQGDYSFSIRACSTNACSAWGPPTVVSVRLPGTPANLRASSTVNTGDFTLSWNAPTGGPVGYYAIYESLDGGATYPIPAIAITTLSLAVNNKPVGLHTYKARACNDAGCSGDSNAVTITVNPPIPAPPGKPTASASPNTGIFYLTWTEASGTVAYYQVEDSIDAGVHWTAVLPNTEIPTPRYNFGSQPPGHHLYRVRACNVSGCSAPGLASDTVIVNPKTPTKRPGTPTASINPNYGDFTLSWGEVTGEVVDGYTVEESSTNGSTWHTAANGERIPNTSLTLSSHTDGKFLFRVKACNISGCGPYSGSVNVTIKIPLPGKAGTPVASSYNNTGDYSLSWTRPTGTIDLYTIEVSDDGGASWVELSSHPSAETLAQNAMEPGHYLYRVRACNSSGCGLTSNNSQVVIVVPEIPESPSMPNVTPNPSTTGNFTLSWVKGAGLVNSYTLEESTNSGPWSVLSSTITTTSMALSNKTTGSYNYRIKACNISGCSSILNFPPVSVERFNHQPNPGQLTATIDEDGLFIGSPTAMSDPDGDPVTLQIMSQPGHGSASITNTKIQYQPEADWNGTDAFVYQACDAQVCASATATLVVKPVNDAPNIDHIDDVTTPVDHPLGPITVRISDVDTPLSALTLTATSSNTDVVNNLGLVLEGADSLHTLRITPVYGASGSTIVELTVGDGSLSASSRFIVTVASVQFPSPILAPIPPPPVGKAGQIRLDWTTVDGAVHYRVEEQINDGAWNPIATETSNSKTLIKTESGGYSYRVLACDETDFCGLESNVRSISINLSSDWLILGACDERTGLQTQICATGNGCTKNETRRLSCPRITGDCGQ